MRNCSRPKAKYTFLNEKMTFCQSVNIFVQYMHTFVPKKREDPNKQGGWKIPYDEISGGSD